MCRTKRGRGFFASDLIRDLIDAYTMRPGDSLTLRGFGKGIDGEGEIVGGPWPMPEGISYDFIIHNPKEKPMHTKITISAGQRLVNPLGGGVRPFCDVKVSTDGPPDAVQRISGVAQASAAGICEAIGIEPLTRDATQAAEEEAPALQMHKAIDGALPELSSIAAELRRLNQDSIATRLEDQANALGDSRPPFTP